MFPFKHIHVYTYHEYYIPNIKYIPEINKYLQIFFTEQVIDHQLTVPYSSFQNGAVERAHRIIEAKARSLLIGGRVPPSLWTEAVSCSVYLLNRTPVVSRNSNIPVCL